MESTMINQLTEEVKNEGIEEGIEKGIKKGIKKERSRIKKLLELENIPKETINKIINNQEKPI